MPASLSQEQRVLLHLHGLSKHWEEYEVPFGLCQDGVAEKLDILLNNVSRALKSLKAQGLVEDKLSHVTGIKRRRRVYHPTTKGGGEARRLTEGLLEKEMRINDGGTERSLRVDGVLDELEKRLRRRPDAFEVVELAEGEILDLDLLVAKLSPDARTKAFVRYLSEAPAVREFVGRQDELRQLTSALSSPDGPAVVIRGIAGMGKSTLAARAIAEMPGDRSVFWYRFRGWDNLRRLGKALVGFLEEGEGEEVVRERVEDDAGPGSLLGAAIPGLRRMAPVLVFDDAHLAPPDARSFLSVLIEAKSSLAGVGVVILSREALPLYDARQTKVSGTVLELNLGGLSPEESALLLGDGISPEKAASAYAWTDGHPLFLELYKFGGMEEGGKARDEFLANEIYARLSGEQKEVMEMLCVHRRPVPASAVLPHGADHAIIQSLEGAGLVIGTAGGLVEVHDILRDFVLGRLSSDALQEAHGRAAQFYSDNAPSQAGSALEALYHHLGSRDWAAALDIAANSVSELASLGETEAALLIEPFASAPLDDAQTARLSFLKGELHSAWEDWPSALAEYKLSLSLLEAADPDAEYLANVYSRMGVAEAKLKRVEATVRSHKKALSALRRSGNSKGMAREHLSLGNAYRAQGLYNEAMASYDKASALVEQLDDDRGLAAVLNNVALLHMGAGELEEAREKLEASLRTARGARDDVGAAMALRNLGELELAAGRTDSALQKLEKAESLLSASGQQLRARRLMMRRGDVLYEHERLDEAVAAYRRGLEHRPTSRWQFKKSGGQEWSGLAARFHSRLASCFRELGEWEECDAHRQTAMETFRKIGDEQGAARELLETALDREVEGDPRAGIEPLKEAMRTLEALGDVQGQLAVGLNTARLQQRSGKPADAVATLKAMKALARRAKDERAAAAVDAQLERLES